MPASVKEEKEGKRWWEGKTEMVAGELLNIIYRNETIRHEIALLQQSYYLYFSLPGYQHKVQVTTLSYVNGMTSGVP